MTGNRKRKRRASETSASFLVLVLSSFLGSSDLPWFLGLRERFGLESMVFGVTSSAFPVFFSAVGLGRSAALRGLLGFWKGSGFSSLAIGNFQALLILRLLLNRHSRRFNDGRLLCERDLTKEKVSSQSNQFVRFKSLSQLMRYNLTKRYTKCT